MPRHLRVALLSLAALGLAAAPLHANKPRLQLQRVDVDKYPLIRADVVLVESDGRVVTGKAKEDFKLVFDSNEQGVASDAKSFEQTVDQVYVVAVVQVSGAMHEVFEDEKRGVKALASAVTRIKGSKMALIGYAQDTKRIAEMGKPEAIEGAASGMAEDTEGTEVHLLDAIKIAIDQLNAKGVPDNARKIIIVFSDGIDVAGGDKKAFQELGKRAHLANIVVDTIGYAPFEPGKLRNLNELAKQTSGVERLCKSTQEVSTQFSSAADEIQKSYVLLFDSVIAGDGKDHTVQVLHDNSGAPVYSQTETRLIPLTKPKEPPKTPFPWALVGWIALIVVLLVVLVLMIRAIARRKPAPPPMAEVPAAAPAGGANRTMALDIGAGDKGPTVGWIVGMTGKYADRTFRLGPSRTVIGTSPEADVLIEDPKVSRKHCEIRFDGRSYTIVDLGSTNGVVLNDKRIPQGELVDGDLFRLGGTEFKFKSIN